jgi:hypothetical protein
MTKYLATKTESPRASASRRERGHTLTAERDAAKYSTALESEPTIVQTEREKTAQEVMTAIRSRTPDEQRQRAAAARSYMQQLLADESGYDEEAWPKVRQVIEENSMSERSRFADA